MQLALLAWVGRWLALEVASYLGRHPREPGPNPLDSSRPPGQAPGAERGIQDV